MAQQRSALELQASEAGVLRRASALAMVAGLLWIPQAWFAAQAVAALIGFAAPLPRDLLGFAFAGVLRMVLSHLSDGMAQGAALRATSELRRRVLMQETRRAQPAPAGEVGSLLSEQIETLRPYVARYLPVRARVAVVPLAILLAALWQSWAAALILLICGPTIPLFMALIGQAAGRASRAQLDQMGTMGALLADRAAALPDIRLLGAKDRLVQGFTAQASELRRRTMRVLSIAFLSSTVLELFAALGVAMMAVFCGFSLLDQIDFGTWGVQMTPASGVFLLLLAPEFFQPMRDFAAVWHDRAGADALAGALAGRDGPDMAGEGAAAAPLPMGMISLRGVRHNGIRYPDVTIAPGVSVAVTGPSGAGKTTLLRMLAGLEIPDEGVIEIGGTALSSLVADAWRANLGWMPQAPHFIDVTVAQNLRMGREVALDGPLRAAEASHIVAKLAQGLQTRLGETGAGVSGGEARRLTLARALAGNPGLILADEPTADLDEKTAQQIADALVAAHQTGCGLIVATHNAELADMMQQRIALGGREEGAADA